MSTRQTYEKGLALWNEPAAQAWESLQADDPSKFPLYGPVGRPEIMLPDVAVSARDTSELTEPPAFDSLSGTGRHYMKLLTRSVRLYKARIDPKTSWFQSAESLEFLTAFVRIQSPDSWPIKEHEIRCRILGIQRARFNATEYELVANLAALPEWLAARGPDPDLWHLLVSYLNYDHEDGVCAVLSWIFDQPGCDKAIAYEALIMIQAEYLVNAVTQADAGHGAPFWGIAKQICERAEGTGFSHAVLKPVDVERPEPALGCLATMQDNVRSMRLNGVQPPWPVPVELLSNMPQGRSAVSRYQVRETELWHMRS
ncbi:MAG: DUF4274 domain-containing protein [Pseudomonadota bacterium]